jgi:hypothetical protein
MKKSSAEIAILTSASLYIGCFCVCVGGGGEGGIMGVRVNSLTSSTQKLKLLGEGSQSTYTLQHPHSHAAREKGANVEIKEQR